MIHAIDRILIDVSNLCHRNYHGYNRVMLHRKTAKDSIVFGLLADIADLARTLQCYDFVFCFDGDINVRQVDYPAYKDKPKAEYAEFLARQILRLREEVLPEIGYHNLFHVRDHEADDVIGWLCKKRPLGEHYCIVSSDKDFYQLLRDESDVMRVDLVTTWNPVAKNQRTASWLREEFGIDPSQWPDFKALVGDESDRIQPIPGIGRVKAIKYLHGTLGEGDAHKNILQAERNGMLEMRRSLVRLPYHRLTDPGFVFRENNVTAEAWRRVATRNGCERLAFRCPVL